MADTKVRRQERPPVPPARDLTRPRPFARNLTATLLDQGRDLSDQIKEHEAALEDLREKRLERWRELERRDVSYRAIGAHCGVSNVSVHRAMKKDSGPRKPPV